MMMVEENLDSLPPTVNSSRKTVMATNVDKESIRMAYEDVRSDSSDTDWAVFKFEGNRIGCTATGSDFDQFRQHFGADERAFGYLRVKSGDEMSKRVKFLFLAWVGPGVSTMKRAKMSTDKALVKDIIANFAVELQVEHDAELNLDFFKGEIKKAGGANYGTGVRDL